MYAVGYPVGHTAVLGAFSKLQKHGVQGGLMGWFATAGSFARIVVPIATGCVFPLCVIYLISMQSISLSPEPNKQLIILFLTTMGLLSYVCK